MQVGAARTRIRKATGRKAEEVRTALQARRVIPAGAESGPLADQLTLDQRAMLREFDGDERPCDLAGVRA